MKQVVFVKVSDWELEEFVRHKTTQTGPSSSLHEFEVDSSQVGTDQATFYFTFTTTNECR